MGFQQASFSQKEARKMGSNWKQVHNAKQTLCGHMTILIATGVVLIATGHHRQFFKCCFMTSPSRNDNDESPNRALVNRKVSTRFVSSSAIQWNHMASWSCMQIMTYKKACFMSPVVRTRWNLTGTITDHSWFWRTWVKGIIEGGCFAICPSWSIIDITNLCTFSAYCDHAFVWYVKLSSHKLFFSWLYDSLNKFLLNDSITMLWKTLIL